METKKVKGSDGFGQSREYEFKILSALEGLTLIHTYGSLCTTALPQLTSLIAAWSESAEGEDKLMDLAAADLAVGGGPLLGMIQAIPAIISTSRIVELAKNLLAGGTVDGQECDEDGMCDLFRGRPHEIYAAIIHAVIANFPDYLPFLDSPDDTTDTKSGGKAKTSK